MKLIFLHGAPATGKLTVATNGEGGFPHLAFEHLRLMGGFTFTHIPYKGSAAIATDVIGGQVQAAIDGITGLTPHVRSGRLRLLAITNRTRVPLWPDTPDDASYGFDNSAGVLGISPVLLERYLAAASRISRDAVGASEIVPGGVFDVLWAPKGEHSRQK